MLKRVVLIAAALLLILPATALADGVIFGFNGGHVFSPRPTAPSGAPATNDPGLATGAAASTLTYVSRFVGPLPGAPAPPTYGVPPVVTGGGTQGTGGINFGTVVFATGPAVGFVGSTSIGDGTIFGPGGFITIVSGGNFDTTTGAITNGTILFSGSFIGPTTLTQLNAPPKWCTGSCLSTFNYTYQLTGPVAGNVDPSLLAHLGLASGTGASGFMITLNFGFIGPSDTLGNPEGGTLNVAVPEPGTLALFGTGLLGLAGAIRRRLMS